MKKRSILLNLAAVVLVASAMSTAGKVSAEATGGNTTDEKSTKIKIVEYGNTTEIPANITTPDVVETSIGTLNFFDGVPTKETAELTQDFLLKARGVDAFLKGIPGASLQGLRKGPASLGADAVGKVAHDAGGF